MDCAFSWEYKSLVDELTQGMEQAKQLRAYLRSSASSASDETQELFLQNILSSYENSLLILKGSNTGSASQSSLPLPPIESPISADECPRRSTDDRKRSFKDQPDQLIDTSTRRKSQAMGTELVRVSAESTGFECPSGDDGYSWRKYGLKDILGATYPRSYYSCAYRHMQNCRAMKQVQRSDDDPTVFEIRYKGHHTCRRATNSQSFISPNTTASSSQMIFHNLQYSEAYLTDVGTVLNLHHSDSDRTDIFSASTSTTSSSNMGNVNTRSLGATSKFPIC